MTFSQFYEGIIHCSLQPKSSIRSYICTAVNTLQAAALVWFSTATDAFLQIYEAHWFSSVLERHELVDTKWPHAVMNVADSISSRLLLLFTQIHTASFQISPYSWCSFRSCSSAWWQHLSWYRRFGRAFCGHPQGRSSFFQRVRQYIQQKTVLPAGFMINRQTPQRCEFFCRVINYIRIVLKSVLELAVTKSLN
jgi:hypothetical protein